MGKFSTKLISVMLSVVMLFCTVLTANQINSSAVGMSASLNARESVRTIDANKLDNATVDEEISEFLSQFDEYECRIDEEEEEIYVNLSKSTSTFTEVYE